MLKKAKLLLGIISTAVLFLIATIAGFKCMAGDIYEEVTKETLKETEDMPKEIREIAKDTVKDMFKKGVIETICYPRWINNEEFCYLDILYEGKVMEFEGRNVTLNGKGDYIFQIYKSNINDSTNKQLIKKLKINMPLVVSSNVSSADIAFKISRENQKIAFYSVKTDDRNITSGYTFYIMDIDGSNMKTYPIDDIKSISDISAGGENLLLSDSENGRRALYIRKFAGGKKIKIYTETYDETNKFFNWYQKNKIMISQVLSIREKNGWRHKYNLLKFDMEDKNTELIYSEELPKFETKGLPDNAKGIAISSDEKIILLGGVCILKEIDNQWKRIGNIELAYPDFSPDGKRIIGLDKDNKIKIIAIDELLK